MKGGEKRRKYNERTLRTERETRRRFHSSVQQFIFDGAKTDLTARLSLSGFRFQELTSASLNSQLLHPPAATQEEKFGKKRWFLLSEELHHFTDMTVAAALKAAI